MNGFFVAAEFAIVKIRTTKLDILIQRGNKRARYAKMLTDHMDASLSVTQLGITLASLGLGWIGEPAVSAFLEPLMRMLDINPPLGHSISLVVGFLIITALHIVLGELAPKSMAIQRVEPVVLGIALPMLIFHKVMYPAVWFLNHVANWVIRHLGFEPAAEEDVAHTEDEIRILMEESHRHGYIDKTELTFVDNVFDFADRNVREIMIPRTDMVCLYLEDSSDVNIKTALEQHLTRYPICRDDKDNIVGFLHIKDLLRSLYIGKKPELLSFIRPVPFVPETMPISNLLHTMQQHRVQLAIVVDEYGGTAGMVTIEDIIEEIVGEIQDEFDEERPFIEKKGTRLYSIDGRMLLNELDDILQVKIDAENIDTVGGWLATRVDTPPRVGQKTTFGINAFFVEEVENIRITRILVKIGAELSEEPDEIKIQQERI
ncbi:CBS domain containing-hemolysin-like protein [Pectinatus haikarae]|uniref:CBS domain containing-hemolysin-like protein n=2 Tax=Pectinatus haikarae TaxID=349096 RepID=A0ABT9Y9N0_9FIRM|nr:CBS domain containing-hemolysin-like protein [Pectinatus haikarae]